MIFDLPWPAHRASDLQVYPPAHLIPNGYIPRKVSSFLLPSLVKISKKKLNEPEPISPQADTREQKLARRVRAEIEKEEYIIEQLRQSAFAAQEAREAAAFALVEAREEAKRKREEEKKRRNENKIRGSGVWSRYEYISPEEVRRREEEKYKVTSGTRRGGRFRDEDGTHEEMRRSAEERRREEEEREKAEKNENETDEDDEAEDGEEEEAEGMEDPDERDRGSEEVGEDNPPRAHARPHRSGTGTGASYVEPPTDESDPEEEPEHHSTWPRPIFRLLNGRMVISKNAIQWTPMQVVDEVTPKRRGRPPGSGKLQRAAAAALAKAEEEARIQRLRSVSNDHDRTPRSHHRTSKLSNSKGKTKIPAHVKTSGIEVSDDLEFRPKMSAEASFPVINEVLLLPSKPANPSDSEFPSVDAASPEAELVDTLSSIEDGADGEVEVEGEIVVVPEEEEASPTKGKGKKRKRHSEGEVRIMFRTKNEIDGAF